MTGIEVAIGLLITWAIRKAGRVGKRADQIVDEAIDTSLDRLHDIVTDKLAGDPSLDKLEVEAGEAGEVTERTRTRVQLALADATEEDPEFARQLATAVRSAVAAMGSPDSVNNKISGNVKGNVVQARDIKGDIIF